MKALTLTTLLAIGSLTIGSTALAETYSAWLKVVAPCNTTVQATSRGPYDLQFVKYPHLFYQAVYHVSTNVSGAGSGEVSVRGNDYQCTYDVFYSQGWKAIAMGSSFHAKCNSVYDAAKGSLLLMVTKTS